MYRLKLLENDILISVLILAMFMVSGLTKVMTFNETVSSLQKRVQMGNISERLYELVIVLVILLEIMVPIVVVNYFVNGKGKDYAYYGLIGLCVFTVLATIMYHPPDFSSYRKSVAFWSNVSLIGGMLLLAKTIDKRDV